MKMLKLILTTFTVFFMLSCSPDQQQEIPKAPNKEGLETALARFNQAFQDGDVAVLESMITDNYVHTNGNSKSIGKDMWLSYLRKREQTIQAGELEVTAYEMQDLEIEYYDDMAIVTGKVLTSSKQQNEVRKNAYRITNIWVYESGNWKRAGFHDGKIE